MNSFCSENRFGRLFRGEARQMARNRRHPARNPWLGRNWKARPFNRRVRLARNGERVELIFRSEEGGPLTLIALENQLLEVMERETEAGAREFIISGELTTYRGRNYVRILKVLRPLDNGNLTP